jgi:serine/threonine protein kinase
MIRAGGGDGALKRRAARIQEQLGDKCRLLELLGCGGMGEVWSAWDVELDREVAIKILGVALSSDPELVARFRHEAKTLAKLTHPRIVHILAIGELAWEGRQYMVMERVPGQTLARILEDLRARGEVLDPVAAAFYAIQIVDALKAAHAIGIIHRDVKPENVMIDDTGYLKLLDFGVAKAAEVTGRHPRGTTFRPPVHGPGASARTRQSVLLGTPRYMAPELIAYGRLDERTDLYPVGIMLVMMLTGLYPYELPDDASEATILRAHLDQAPILRRERSPGCPPELWDIALKLMEKDPDARYQSAEEADEALSAYLRESVPPDHPVAQVLDEERREREHRRAYERATVTKGVKAEGAEKETTTADGPVRLPATFVPPTPCADVMRPTAAGKIRLSVGAPFPLPPPARADVMEVNSLRAGARRPELADVTRPVPAGGTAGRIPGWVARPRQREREWERVMPERRVGRMRMLATIAMATLGAWAVIVAGLMAWHMAKATPMRSAPVAMSATAMAIATASAAATTRATATASPAATATAVATARRPAERPAATPKLPPLPF